VGRIEHPREYRGKSGIERFGEESGIELDLHTGQDRTTEGREGKRRNDLACFYWERSQGLAKKNPVRKRQKKIPTHRNPKQNKPAPRGAVNKPWRVRSLISEETHAFIVKKRLVGGRFLSEIRAFIFFYYAFEMR
jgi:hypothetical protein